MDHIYWAAINNCLCRPKGTIRVTVDSCKRNVVTMRQLYSSHVGPRAYTSWETNRYSLHWTPKPLLAIGDCASDRGVTRFAWHIGLQQFICMPFGLINRAIVIDPTQKKVHNKRTPHVFKLLQDAESTIKLMKWWFPSNAIWKPDHSTQCLQLAISQHTIDVIYDFKCTTSITELE